MIKFDVTKQNINKHSPRCPVIYNYPYRILIIGASGSGKTNSFFNLKSKQPEFDKIYLYAEHPHEAKYRFLINRRKSTGFLMILKLLLNTQMMLMIFMKTLQNRTQMKKVKY